MVKKKTANKQLKNGWAYDSCNGTVYKFSHISRKKAQGMEEYSDIEIFIVETINTTIADDGSLHHNKYFTMGLSTAILLAAKIQIDSVEVAESVVGIMVATDKEIKEYFKAQEYFDKKMPDAIPLGQVSK